MNNKKKIMNKITKIVESLVAVNTCPQLVLNDKEIINSIKDRTMLCLDSIGLSLCSFVKKEHHNHQRCGP